MLEFGEVAVGRMHPAIGDLTSWMVLPDEPGCDDQVVVIAGLGPTIANAMVCVALEAEQFSHDNEHASQEEAMKAMFDTIERLDDGTQNARTTADLCWYLSGALAVLAMINEAQARAEEGNG